VLVCILMMILSPPTLQLSCYLAVTCLQPGFYHYRVSGCTLWIHSIRVAPSSRFGRECPNTEVPIGSGHIAPPRRDETPDETDDSVDQPELAVSSNVAHVARMKQG
jgi:hypothetical protein